MNRVSFTEPIFLLAMLLNKGTVLLLFIFFLFSSFLCIYARANSLRMREDDYNNQVIELWYFIVYFVIESR